MKLIALFTLAAILLVSASLFAWGCQIRKGATPGSLPELTAVRDLHANRLAQPGDIFAWNTRRYISHEIRAGARLSQDDFSAVPLLSVPKEGLSVALALAEGETPATLNAGDKARICPALKDPNLKEDEDISILTLFCDDTQSRCEALVAIRADHAAELAKATFVVKRRQSHCET